MSATQHQSAPMYCDGCCRCGVESVSLCLRRALANVSLQVAAPSPPKKKKTVEMAQGKWAEILIHTDRVTKVFRFHAPKCGRRTSGVVVVVPDCRIQKHRLAALGLAMVCFAPLSCRVYMISLKVLGRVEGLPPSLSPRFWARNDAVHRRSVLENDCYSRAAKCRSFGLYFMYARQRLFLRRRQQPFFFFLCAANFCGSSIRER